MQSLITTHQQHLQDSYQCMHYLYSFPCIYKTFEPKGTARIVSLDWEKQSWGQKRKGEGQRVQRQSAVPACSAACNSVVAVVLIPENPLSWSAKNKNFESGWASKENVWRQSVQKALAVPICTGLSHDSRHLQLPAPTEHHNLPWGVISSISQSALPNSFLGYQIEPKWA